MGPRATRFRAHLMPERPLKWPGSSPATSGKARAVVKSIWPGGADEHPHFRPRRSLTVSPEGLRSYEKAPMRTAGSPGGLSKAPRDPPEGPWTKGSLAQAPVRSKIARMWVLSAAVKAALPAVFVRWKRGFCPLGYTNGQTLKKGLRCLSLEMLVSEVPLWICRMPVKIRSR